MINIVVVNIIIIIIYLKPYNCLEYMKPYNCEQINNIRL